MAEEKQDKEFINQLKKKIVNKFYFNEIFNNFLTIALNKEKYEFKSFIKKSQNKSRANGY